MAAEDDVLEGEVLEVRVLGRAGPPPPPRRPPAEPPPPAPPVAPPAVVDWPGASDVRAARGLMILRLRAAGVDDPAVLDALGRVPREDFVLPEEAARAHDEVRLPTGLGGSCPAPLHVAESLALLRLQPPHHLLVVGAGTGYVACVASLLCGRVTAAEPNAQLARRAAAIAARLGYDNVVVAAADATRGVTGRGPFDRVLAVADVARAPRSLLHELAPNGLLVASVDGRLESYRPL